MKDITGHVIFVGDKIAYADAWGNAKLTLGKVVGLTKKGGVDAIVVERYYDPTITNGLTEKWVWDDVNKTGEYVSTKPANTVITYSNPSRCIIIAL